MPHRSPREAAGAVFHGVVRTLRGIPLREATRIIEKFRTLGPEERDRYRAESLRALLERLPSCAYYRTNSNPPDRGTPTGSWDTQLSRLPLIEKSDIRDHEAAFVAPGIRTEWRKTSGSTGMPLRFRKDRWALAIMDAVMWDRYSWYGIQPGDLEARVWGRALSGLPLVRQRSVDFGANRRRLSAFTMTRESVAEYFDHLTRSEPKLLYAYPSALARAIDILGPNWKARLRDLPFRVIICTGETLLDWQRELFRDSFSAPIANEYGSTENGIIAFECPNQTLHVCEEAVILELKDDRVVQSAPGSGQAVVTELHSRSVTFVRYVLGDRLVVSRKDCGCGRFGLSVDSVLGREDAFIRFPDGRQVYDAILAYGLGGKIGQFRARQDDVDSLDIEVVPRADQGSDEALRITNDVLRAVLGDSLRTRVRIVDVIPPEPTGKMRYFIPLRS